MTITSARIAACLAIALSGLWLFADAHTFPLMPADAASGRMHGCYAILELCLGRPQPSDVLRTIQGYAAVVLTLGGFGCGTLVFMHHRRSLKCLRVLPFPKAISF